MFFVNIIYRKSNVGKYALGSLIFGFSSVVVYAKYDANFRHWLTTNVYGSDELLKLIFEDKPASEQKGSTTKSKCVFKTQYNWIFVLIQFSNKYI